MPFGSFTGCIQTEDWNAIEGRNESLEFKYYCPNVGAVREVSADSLEESTDLVAMTVP